jgi:hypothetical protein
MRRAPNFYKFYKLEEKSILETDTRNYVLIIYSNLFNKVILFLITITIDIINQINIMLIYKNNLKQLQIYYYFYYLIKRD